jgi:hypothetical protein
VYRFDVALLVPQASPVLVLRHIIINASHYKGLFYFLFSCCDNGFILMNYHCDFQMMLEIDTLL